MMFHFMSPEIHGNRNMMEEAKVDNKEREAEILMLKLANGTRLKRKILQNYSKPKSYLNMNVDSPLRSGYFSLFYHATSLSAF